MSSAKNCYIFDIDGTLADCTHRLHHVQGKKRDYDSFYADMSKDAPIKATIDLTHALGSPETDILIVSGRPSNYMYETIKWLNSNGVLYNRTFFRQAGDFRADHIVKKEILDHILKEGYNILAVFDDRPSVVKMWRENGLTCLQNEWHGEVIVPDNMTTLAIMVGPTCAGKSTYVKNNPKFDNFAAISSDDLRTKICGSALDQTKNDEVFKLAHKLIRLYLESGVNVVFDATNIRNKDRLAVVNCAPHTTQVEYHVINRPMEEKYRDGGWRNDLGFDIIAKHEQTFKSNLKNILSGDSLGYIKVYAFGDL